MLKIREYQGNIQILDKLNYFFNPKIIKIEEKDFVAERIGCSDLGNLTTTASGLKVYQMG